MMFTVALTIVIVGLAAAQSCPDGQDYDTAKRTCLSRDGAEFDPQTCRCNTCPDSAQDIKNCAGQNGRWIAEKCACDTTPIVACRPTAELVEACKLRSGSLDNRCQCIVPEPCKFPGLPLVCEGLGGVFSPNSCTCFRSKCSVDEFGEAYKKCLASTTAQVKYTWNMERCACQREAVTPTEPCTVDREVASLCSRLSGRYNTATCDCEGEKCSLARLRACDAIGGRFDVATCQCATPCTPNIAEMAACKRLGGVYNQAKCQCENTRCSVARLLSCDRTNGQFDVNTCQCSAPPCEINRDDYVACRSLGGSYDTATCQCADAKCDDLAAWTKCRASGGLFDAARCACSAAPEPCMVSEDVAKACTVLSGNYNRATCTCEKPKCAVALFTRCQQNRGRFNVEDCSCASNVCPYDASYHRACLSVGGVYSRDSCTCEEPRCKASAFLECQKEQGFFDSRSCTCTVKPPTPACVAAREFLYSCRAVQGRYNAETCECDKPQCPVSIYDRCAAANLKFDLEKCTCQIQCTDVQKRDCDSRGLLMNSRCACYSPQPTCSDEVLQKCRDAGMAFDRTNCRCVPTKCSDEKAKECDAAGGRFDADACACHRINQCTDDEYAKVKEHCSKLTPVEGWVFFVDSETCRCTRKQVVTEVCTPAKFEIVEQQCKRLNGQATNIKYTANKATCVCDKEFIDLPCEKRNYFGDLRQKCASADMTINLDTCTCEHKCPSGRPLNFHATLCKARGLDVNEKTCECVEVTKPPEPVVCDYASLKANCERFADLTSIFDVVANVKTCTCERYCKGTKTPINDVRKKCAEANLVFDSEKCSCLDACQARGVTAREMMSKCKANNLEFVAGTCTCQRPAPCAIRCKAPLVLDQTKCECVREEVTDCRLTAEFANLAKKCLLQDGFVLKGCECVRSCPRESGFFGASIEDAYARCVAAGGRFNKETCECQKPTKPCATRTPCRDGFAPNPNANCVCQQTCPSGQFYGELKAACYKRGDDVVQWDVKTCACSRKCTGAYRDQYAAACKARELGFDDEKCACVKDEEKCDPRSEGYAIAKNLCFQRDGRWNAETCQCERPEVPPPVCDGKGNAIAAAACKEKGGEFKALTCECTDRCRATAAAFMLKSRCEDGQRFDGCQCVDVCVEGTRSYDYNKEVCAKHGGRFNPTDCGCLRKCDVTSDAVRSNMAKCKENEGRFDYVSCSCKLPEQEEKCSSAVAEKLHQVCTERGDDWKFSKEHCRCYAAKAVQLTIKTELSDEVVEAIKNRVAVMLKNCDIEFRSASKTDGMGTHVFNVQLQSVGPDAGSCVEKLESVKERLGAFAEVADAQLVEAELDVDVPEPIMDIDIGSASATFLATGAALMCTVALVF